MLPIIVQAAQARNAPPSAAAGHAIGVPGYRHFRDVIALTVDATDTNHHLFTVHETIPVQSTGDVVLFYPEWETASHAPTVSAIGLAGLEVSVDGRKVEWRRDPLDIHAFHITVPAQARLISLTFDYLPARNAALLRRDMVDVQWQHLLLYPAGWSPWHIPVDASLMLPPGLRVFTAIPMEKSAAGESVLQTVTLEDLVDAPAYAARYWRRFDLASASMAPVHLDVVADDPKDIAPSERELRSLREMVKQTLMIFGPPPYRHYDVIVSLSDKLSPGGGIEHLEEGENNLPATYLTDPVHHLNDRDLIAHEFVHSWNGLFRRPTGMQTFDYNTPSNDSLLWVYEGQTEFWGRVIAARAGLRSTQETLDKLALDAAIVANRLGREWKTLEDSTNDPVYMAGHPVAWRDWQRREDYYPEGVLLWLDVDARLRELSGGRKSLDDFAHIFFATGRGLTAAYSFGDVCTALNALAPADWSHFLLAHLRTHDTAQVMAGLARAGWRLAYGTVPTETFRQDEDGDSNLDYSIGLRVDAEGKVESVVWQGAAFVAGMVAGDRLVSVDGAPFSLDALQTAVKDAPHTPILITYDDDGQRRTARLNYSGTLRYPRLERIPGTPDRLSPLLASRRSISTH